MPGDWLTCLSVLVLSKETRDMFAHVGRCQRSALLSPPVSPHVRSVSQGSLDEIRENLQSGMSYCAKDVLATHLIFQKVCCWNGGVAARGACRLHPSAA